jgi:membrane peptidoglycan carboxypeptidase
MIRGISRAGRAQGGSITQQTVKNLLVGEDEVEGVTWPKETRLPGCAGSLG